jgi:hypothetical protein
MMLPSPSTATPHGQTNFAFGSWPVLVPSLAASGDRRHRAVRSDLAQAVVFFVRDDDITLAVDSNAAWPIERRLGASPVLVPIDPIVAASRKCRHGAVRSDLAHAMSPAVYDDDVALTVNSNAGGVIENRLRATPVLVPRISGSGDRRHCAHF